MSTVPSPKLGMLIPFGPGLVSSPLLREFAGILEAEDVESVWAVEHVVVAASYEPNYPYSADGRMPSAPGVVPMPDPLEVLAHLAAITERLRLGTCVVVAPLHSPAVLAKRAATLDLLSAGRFLLGLGIGWQRKEYAAVGVPFERRGERLEECIGAMRSLWTNHPASYEGQTVSFRDVHLTLAPTAGHVPIILGGNSEPAIRRAGRIADGWFPFTIGPDEFARGADLLREAAEAAGRSADDVEISVWPGSSDPTRELDAAWIRRYLDAGATRVITRPRVAKPLDLERLPEQIRRFRSVLAEAAS
ncbi:MAG TPA: LLM class F420-dependent oxidoreductase [Frankiaceae bacterium]|nr:LLM class F420-dependent oxidoreductase [Frankiaceae bacterium]